ncbi:MAG: hypothetical protein ABSD96_20600 [Candidatus Korobacteraceae bacterium]
MQPPKAAASMPVGRTLARNHHVMKNTHRIVTAAFAIAASFLFTGCGAATHMGANTPAFVNQTNMQDADFQTLAKATWNRAQTQTSSQWIDLWAAYRDLQNEPADPNCYTGAISCEGFIPPVPSAASLEARGVVIAAVSDVPAGPGTPDNPSGIIRCGGGTGYCNAYVVYEPCNIKVPSSKPENMGPYEMQNCMLHQLGYDVSRR